MVSFEKVFLDRSTALRILQPLIMLSIKTLILGILISPKHSHIVSSSRLLIIPITSTNPFCKEDWSMGIVEISRLLYCLPLIFRSSTRGWMFVNAFKPSLRQLSPLSSVNLDAIFCRSSSSRPHSTRLSSLAWMFDFRPDRR